MESSPSSNEIITNLKQNVHALIEKLRRSLEESIEFSDSESVNKLEKELHKSAKELADTITGIKLQEYLMKLETKATEKELVKSQPSKMKNMGLREVNIRMLGGTKIPLIVTYYHRQGTLKKYKGKKGVYPGLLLLGIGNHYSPGLESLVCLMATAASSFDEASFLVAATLAFKVDVKRLKATVKYFGEKARISTELEDFELPDDFSGRTVAASTDGGRVRIRKNKRGKKTKKGRTRYHTDWREPKLIIIYVVGEDGKKERKISPMMDASLNGPDETFAMLIFYLKQLKVQASDLLLFISDGANWIWERAKNLASNLGISTERCMFALDYYHAVEHLSGLASLKRWNKKAKEKWVNLQKKRLLTGKLEKFIEEIEQVCKGSKNAKVKREREYFKKHLPHMKYTELKSQGLPIGSGAVESGIRRVVNLRLKGPGIFWHEDTADAMLMLRSYYKAGRWNTLENMVFSGRLATI
jgi:hypothetical protein